MRSWLSVHGAHLENAGAELPKAPPTPQSRAPARLRTGGDPTSRNRTGTRYFSVPAVSPACTCRWNDRYTTSTGTIAIVIPANNAGKSPAYPCDS